MKRGSFLLFFLCATLWAMSQEVLVPVAGHPSSALQDATRWDKASAKTVDTLSLFLPFFDDFSDYDGAPSHKLWLNDDAYVNKDFGPLPPTVGVVTLDALKANGDLHAGAGTSSFSGDTLLSQFIRLDSVFTPQGKRLQPGDSVYLSFYYLPGGGYGDMWARIGDTPEEQDSLLLEFYNPTENAWQRVWGCAGVSVDTLIAHTGSAWQWASVPITNSEFFKDNFQFRFRNLCSMDPTAKVGMAANCDQWNIDYIRLGEGRTWRDSLIRDVAFVNKAPSMLRRYQAMPARQFTAAEMAQNVEMTITNRYSQTLSTHYAYYVYNQQGTQVATYDGGSENAAPYAQGHAYQTAGAHAEPPVNFVYNLGGGRQSFTVTHVVSEGFSGDELPQNDTVRFSQVFDNYFAYDDGVPENGYGLTSTSSRLDMAVMFVLNVPDTLTALDLYFNRTRDDENVGIGFNLCVWPDNGGKPGAILHKDSETHHVTADHLEAFTRYKLAEPVILQADTYYIGFEQTSKNFINIGFDRSRDISGQNFYRTTSVWQQSILNGAVLLRPCFGVRATVDISTVAENDTLDLRVYPNPTDGLVNIELPASVAAVSSTAADGFTMQLYDRQGRCLLNSPYCATLNMQAYPSGLYLLRVCDVASGHYATRKIILRK